MRLTHVSSAQLVDLEKFSGDGSNLIALAGTKGGSTIEQFIEDAAARNFSALIMRASFSADTAGYNEYVVRRPRKDMSSVRMAVCEVGKADRDALVALLDKGTLIRVNLTRNDPNAWIGMTKSPAIYFLQAVSLGLALGLSIFAAIKLTYFIREQGPKLTVSQLAFVVEIIGNLLRLVYSIDPVYVHYLFDEKAQNYLITLSFPFSFITTTLIAIYWHEILTQEALCPKVFPDAYKPAFIVASVLLLALELTASSLRAFTSLGLIFTVISAGFALLVNVAVTVYFSVIGRSVYKTVQGTPLAQTTRIILAGAGFNFVLAVVLIFIAIPSILWSPVGAPATWFFAYLALYGLSLTKILAFSPKSMKKGRTNLVTVGGGHGTKTFSRTEGEEKEIKLKRRSKASEIVPTSTEVGTTQDTSERLKDEHSDEAKNEEAVAIPIPVKAPSKARSRKTGDAL